MKSQLRFQATVTGMAEPDPSGTMDKIALFNPDGSPFTGSGGGPGGPVTGEDVLLTGLQPPPESGDAELPADTDTVNDAITKMVYMLMLVADPHADDIGMDGYVFDPENNLPISETDRVLAAISKLEARMVILETNFGLMISQIQGLDMRVTALENP